MNVEAQYFVGFFVAINLLAFLLMYLDKMRSRKNAAERISEGMLFFMATVFGSVGVLAGMFVFRHKTQKWYFLLGIPMLIAENCAMLWVVYEFFGAARI
jgi:uncharacterized membrane protein YsdA (DUF1294 family)